MELIQKKFNELTPQELYKIVQLRSRVFVIEQNCIFEDLDDRDMASTHIFYKQGDIIIAYSRIVPKGISFNETSFGRICVDKTCRSQKLGEKIVNDTIKYIFDIMNCENITISSQEYLGDFYKKFGFEEMGKVYSEDGILHRDMSLIKEDYKNCIKSK